MTDRADIQNEHSLQIEHILSGPRFLTDAYFLEDVRRRNLNHSEFLQAPAEETMADAVDGLGVALSTDRNFVRREWVIELGASLALIVVARESVDINVAAPNRDCLREAIDTISAALGIQSSRDESRCWVTFWSGDREGQVSTRSRRVEVPPWTELRADHPVATADQLEQVMELDRPAGGKLIIWHGEPGTGKTHATRALLRAWAPWCVPHFIADPELLLGDASYILRVLTACDPDSVQDRRWRLLILEDAGELLTADARERSGQALSRLLNATDGLLGQSTNTLVLVTTNEPLGKLHPALTRAGRCLSEVEFRALPMEQANAWLADRGSSVAVSTPASIADLYATLNGRPVQATDRSVGFAA